MVVANFSVFSVSTCRTKGAEVPRFDGSTRQRVDRHLFALPCACLLLVHYPAFITVPTPKRHLIGQLYLYTVKINTQINTWLPQRPLVTAGSLRKGAPCYLCAVMHRADQHACSYFCLNWSFIVQLSTTKDLILNHLRIIFLAKTWRVFLKSA